MEFYSVKHRKKVEVPTSDLKRKIYNVKGKGGNMMTRYAVRAMTSVDGEQTSLTKFVSKDAFDALNAPME